MHSSPEKALAPCLVPQTDILSLKSVKAYKTAVTLTFLAIFASLLYKLLRSLREHICAKIPLHVIDLHLVVVDGALKVLVVILVTLYDVEVALREPPVGHGSPVDVVEVVEEHACPEMLQL